jgi:hypothetical protein
VEFGAHTRTESSTAEGNRRRAASSGRGAGLLPGQARLGAGVNPGWVHRVRPLAGAGLELVLGRGGEEKEGVGCWAAQRKRERRWRAGPAGEYGPRGFWKILKTFLFPILIQIQI